MKKNNRAFTLIELLAVIAIISIIAAIATPNVIKLINKSNEDQIYSDAKLAISKAKYKYRKDSATNNDEKDYPIDELIDTEGKDYGNYNSCVSVRKDGTENVVYSIYIDNGKYSIGTACGNGTTEAQINTDGKEVITKK